MNQAEILFQKGAEFSDQGDIAQIKHKSVDYKALYEKAYLLKKEAALLMSPEDKHPMHRTWVMNGAASLAYKAGKYEEAQKTVALCRTLDPDDYTSSKLDELEDLIRKAIADRPRNGSLRVTGVLTAANADEKEIKIRDLENQQVYAFIVPAKLFKNVVKSYWQEAVLAVAKVSPHGIFTLQKISPVA